MSFARCTRAPDGGSSGRAVRLLIYELNEIDKKVISVVNCICAIIFSTPRFQRCL
jgi:hypothetical protein